MEDYNWGDFGTWNNPLVLPVTYVDDVEFPTLAPVLSTVKLVASMKFLQVYADIVMRCDGTSATSPARIYAITPYVDIGAGVSKKVS
jgi:hypothetical protein